MSKYDVVEFVDLYKKTGNDIVKQQKLLKDINIKKYIPYDTKKIMAEKMISDTCIKESGFVFNSPTRYLAYALSIIILYTDLKCEQEDSSLDYDLLKESGLFETILLQIGDDIKEYKIVWTMCYEDLIQNENTTIKFIKQNVEHFGLLCNNGLIKLAEAINNFTSQDVKNIILQIKNKAQDFIEK